tara:strand:- start:55 stop:177 length:123 start_codon:yes stop_codon:yes gene_type:complete
MAFPEMQNSDELESRQRKHANKSPSGLIKMWLGKTMEAID